MCGGGSLALHPKTSTRVCFQLVRLRPCRGRRFDDLDVALKSGSSEKRVTMLRQVTDLFLSETGDCFDFGRDAR
jgi:hypothetical protein